jgi:uncharacterized protein (TIGR02594 family)
METAAERMLKVALSQYGIKEKEGHGNNPDVVKYFRETGFDISNDDIGWCSAFLMWCAMVANVPYPKSLVARDWLDWGIPVLGPSMKPQLGDVVVYWRDSIYSWKAHCNLYIRHHSTDVYGLGGNQSNSVNISVYSGSRILGIRRCTQ